MPDDVTFHSDSSDLEITSQTRGPVKIGKMELVHAPGHIFWKKKPKSNGQKFKKHFSFEAIIVDFVWLS